MTHMLNEIREQPAILREVRTLGLERMSAIAAEVKRRNIRSVYIAARGTSDHVAHYAKYAIEIEVGLPVALAAPSVYTAYNGRLTLDSQTLVIGISQSGEGPDVVEVCERARASGALTMCITNTEASLLARTVEYPVVTPAGLEVSVAATKTYTSALAEVALLTAALSSESGRLLAELSEMPALLESVIASANRIFDVANRYAEISECLVIGRGYNHCTAAEIALKLMETSLIGAKSFSAADFLHGPVAIIRPGLTCVLVAPSDATLANMDALAQRLSSNGCSIITMTDRNALPYNSEDTILLPRTPYWLSPIGYVVAGQLFAHGLCLAKGLDPDRPVGLNKVTKTV